jgi:hypothetical protein
MAMKEKTEAEGARDGKVKQLSKSEHPDDTHYCRGEISRRRHSEIHFAALIGLKVAR